MGRAYLRGTYPNHLSSPSLALGAGLVSGVFLFIGIGFASVNQCGEHSPHLIPYSQMGPPSVYSRVRGAGGGNFSKASILFTTR